MKFEPPSVSAAISKIFAELISTVLFEVIECYELLTTLLLNSREINRSKFFILLGHYSKNTTIIDYNGSDFKLFLLYLELICDDKQ